MFMLLQNVLNLSEINLPLESDVIFFGKPHSEQTIWHISIKLSVYRSSTFLMTGNLRDNLQYKSSFYCVRLPCLCQLPPMVWLGFHGVLSFLFFVFTENQDMQSNFYVLFKISIHICPINLFICHEFSSLVPIWLTLSSSNARF